MDQAILEAWLETIEPALVRVFAGRKRWIGSAFAIGPRALLTAYRVVEGLGSADIDLDGHAFRLPQRIQRIEADPKCGVALLVLDAAAPDPASRLPLASANPTGVRAVIAAGYSDPEGPLTGIALGHDIPIVPTPLSNAGPAIPGHLGGSPIVCEGKVVGIVAPRDGKPAQAAPIPISALRPFLARHAALIADEGERLTAEQAAMLTALRSPDAGTPIPFDLIEVVRSQPAASLTAHRLQRIAHWRQKEVRLDQRYVQRTLVAENVRKSPRTTGAALRVGVFNHLGAFRAAHARDPALVLTGVVGSGRSTYLAHHEHELAVTALLDPAGPHPFVFFLASDSARPATGLAADPLAWLASQWSELNPNLPSLFELMRARPTVFLLDDLIQIPGWDGYQGTTASACWCDVIVRLSTSYPLTQIVFSGAVLDGIECPLTPGIPGARSVPRAQFDPIDAFETTRARDLHTSRRIAAEPSECAIRDGFDPTTTTAAPDVPLSTEPGGDVSVVTPRTPARHVVDPEPQAQYPRLHASEFNLINQYTHYLDCIDSLVMPRESDSAPTRPTRIRRFLTLADEPPDDPLAAALALDATPFGTTHFGFDTPPLQAALSANDMERFIATVAECDLVLAAHCARASSATVSAQLKDQLRIQLLARAQAADIDLDARLEAGLMLGHFGDFRFRRSHGSDAAFIEPPRVRVRGGAHVIGSHGSASEQPLFTTVLSAFEIGQFPITNAEWQCFVDANGYEDPRWWDETAPQRQPEGAASGIDRPPPWRTQRFNNPSQPVVGVNWSDARAFCRWLSHQSGREFRLPMETEWEAAARQGTTRLYPWDDDYDPGYANTAEVKLCRTSVVGMFPQGATPGTHSIYDLAGNCWEWTSDPATAYPHPNTERHEAPGAIASRVIRGGSWREAITFARATARLGLDPAMRFPWVGFRVVCPILANSVK